MFLILTHFEKSHIPFKLVSFEISQFATDATPGKLSSLCPGCVSGNSRVLEHLLGFQEEP